jgi:hypothetical protein
MAKVVDYVGAEFGPFVIDQYLDSGQEADVFTCTDRRTNLAYVLRLDSNDPEVWSGPPSLPPRNASIERANARGSWLHSQRTWQANVRARQDDVGTVITAVDVYGVLNGQWLIPVSAPERPRGVVDVDRLAGAVTTVADSLVWKELCQAIAAHLEPPAALSDETIDAALERLASPALLEAAAPWIVMSDAAPETARRAVASLSGPPGSPPVDENLLLRIMVAIARDHLTADQATACLRCRHFRANVAIDEVHQLVAAHNLVGTVIGLHSAPLYAWLIEQLTRVPADSLDDAAEFALDDTPPDLERFELFLQSPAGESQQPVVMAFEPDGSYQLSVGRVSL